MVTLIEINKAINDRIKASLERTAFNQVPILAEDVSEPIVRPSIKVEIENSTNGKFNANCREMGLTCKAYFFAKDRNKYKIDNSKMQDLLESAFLEDLQIAENFYVSIEEVRSEVTDTVLICSFDLYIVEELDSAEGENAELMEELDFSIEKE